GQQFRSGQLLAFVGRAGAAVEAAVGRIAGDVAARHDHGIGRDRSRADPAPGQRGPGDRSGEQRRQDDSESQETSRQATPPSDASMRARVKLALVCPETGREGIDTRRANPPAMTNPEDLLPAIANEASGLATDLLAVTRAEVERLVGLRRKAEESLAAARAEAQRLVADARASAEAELARRWSDTEHAC